MQREKATIKYWKQRAATWIFNYLWRDEESGMQEMLEKSINSRVTAGIMNWLDHRHIRHCRYCPTVDESPLKSHDGYHYCTEHYDMQLKRDAESQSRLKVVS